VRELLFTAENAEFAEVEQEAHVNDNGSPSRESFPWVSPTPESQFFRGVCLGAAMPPILSADSAVKSSWQYSVSSVNPALRFLP
jgi:hypothetical protein